MTANKQNAAIVGIGVAACAACCAGPILGVLAAIGLASAAGAALFGTTALLAGALAAAIVMIRRRRRTTTCIAVDAEPVSVGLSATRARS